MHPSHILQTKIVAKMTKKKKKKKNHSKLVQVSLLVCIYNPNNKFDG